MQAYAYTHTYKPIKLVSRTRNKNPYKVWFLPRLYFSSHARGSAGSLDWGSEAEEGKRDRGSTTHKGEKKEKNEEEKIIGSPHLTTKRIQGLPARGMKLRLVLDAPL